jgi:hypothetical protein
MATLIARAEPEPERNATKANTKRRDKQLPPKCAKGFRQNEVGAAKLIQAQSLALKARLAEW